MHEAVEATICLEAKGLQGKENTSNDWMLWWIGCTLSLISRRHPQVPFGSETRFVG